MCKTSKPSSVFLGLALLPLLTFACSSPKESTPPATHPESTTQTQPAAMATPEGHPAIPSHEQDTAHMNMMGDMATSGSADQHMKNPLTFKVPDGWREVAPTALRNPNFQVGDPANPAQAYVTIMGGTGGGLVMNVNRWLGQMGQPPLSEEAIGQLEKVTVLGQPAPLLEAKGTFTGMQGGNEENQALMATAWLSTDFSVFVKMIGPEPVVSANRDAFLAFCRSLALNVPNAPAP